MKAKKSKKLNFKNNRSMLAIIIALASIVIVAGFLTEINMLKASADVAAKVCDLKDSIDCMSIAPGTSIQGGRYIYGVLDTQTWTWNVSHSSICNNGYVSNSGTCPFRPGSGLNKKYDGLPIYRFKLHDNTDFCASADSNYLYLRNCSFYGQQLWVREPHGSTYSFINVAASNNADDGMAMTMCYLCHMYISLDNGSGLTSHWSY